MGAPAHKLNSHDSTTVPELAVIDELRNAFALTFHEIAQVLGARESTLHRWLSGATAPSPVYLRRLQLVEEFQHELRDTFPQASAQELRDWLRKRMPPLGNRRPIDLLLDGRVEQLIGMLYGFKVGMPL